MQHTFSQATLEELRAATEKFAIEREWERFHSPRNLLLALVSTEWLVGSVCLLVMQMVMQSQGAGPVACAYLCDAAHMIDILQGMVCYLPSAVGPTVLACI